MRYTHYTREGAGDGMVRVFFQQDCETCGGPVVAANVMKMSENILHINPLLIELQRLPNEQWYDEDLGQCVCETCA